MRFGLCAGPENLAAATDAGYDYLEPGASALLQPKRPEEEILSPLRLLFAPPALRSEVFNQFLPRDMKVVGPDEDPVRQVRYLEAVFKRARLLGGEIIVFGSGAARQIPVGWPLTEARRQTLAFLGRCADAAERHGMVVAVEPLNMSECNHISSVAEAFSLAQSAQRPAALGVLSDLYHIAHDGQSYEETWDAMPLLRHVHIAGQGRRAPVAADHDFLCGFLAVLKGAGYAGRISIEAGWENVSAQAAESLAVLRRAWEAA